MWLVREFVRALDLALNRCCAAHESRESRNALFPCPTCSVQDHSLPLGNRSGYMRLISFLAISGALSHQITKVSTSQATRHPEFAGKVFMCPSLFGKAHVFFMEVLVIKSTFMTSRSFSTASVGLVVLANYLVFVYLNWVADRSAEAIIQQWAFVPVQAREMLKEIVGWIFRRSCHWSCRPCSPIIY